MFRSRGENLRAVFILLFLNVAFFLLEHQDPARYARLFRFDGHAVQSGEVWRLVTYQFTQAGQGIMQALSLFITLLLLYMMGSAIEEEWGTWHLITLFTLSTLGSAGVAALIGITLLGTYFVYFTLLFVYASAFGNQTFYLFGMIPVRVRILALFSLAILLYGVFSGGMANLAALGGAAIAYVYYLSQRVRVKFVPPAKTAEVPPALRADVMAMHNAARYAGIKQALAGASEPDIERLIAQSDRETVPGVNICPPADYKPEAVDGYCIRCEGFAECSARHLRLNRPRPATKTLAVPNPDAP
ncbi:MAG TPA: rhomboid family intramembrane serine protease [Thermoanaerobaculia bacterium]|nr:rhomboid family intramembrane serine protease [Thermoanaerobaculia bacterium]